MSQMVAKPRRRDFSASSWNVDNPNSMSDRSAPLSEGHRREAVDFLRKSNSGIHAVGLMLRADDELLRIWSRPTQSVVEKLNESFDSKLFRFNQLSELWTLAGPKASPFRRLNLWAETGMVLARAPLEDLIRFLSIDELTSEQSPVTGVVLDQPCAAPEKPVKDALAAANYNPEDNFERTLERLRQLGDAEDAYLASLGVQGLAELVRAYRGKNRAIFCIDSGCDEKHLALNQSVQEYIHLEYEGFVKHTHYCSDRGCHGTKVLGTILARPLDLEDLGIELKKRIRIGLAPEAHGIVINALDGGPMTEGCTKMQIVAGLEAVTGFHRKAAMRGGSRLADICNISIALSSEPSPASTATVDRLLVQMKSQGIVPVLSAGNRGTHSNRLGTEGLYVGAADAEGRSWEGNLGHVDVLAPGVDLLVFQPWHALLGRRPMGMHSGTSLATGVMSGMIALVAERTGQPALEVANAMRTLANDNHSCIDLTETVKHLTS